jgi:hypothetical protein
MIYVDKKIIQLFTSKLACNYSLTMTFELKLSNQNTASLIRINIKQLKN